MNLRTKKNRISIPHIRENFHSFPFLLIFSLSLNKNFSFISFLFYTIPCHYFHSIKKNTFSSHFISVLSPQALSWHDTNVLPQLRTTPKKTIKVTNAVYRRFQMECVNLSRWHSTSVNNVLKAVRGTRDVQSDS